MGIELFTNIIVEYLKCDDIIDYNNEAVAKLADTLYEGSKDELDFIRKAYEYVRDRFPHSADAGEDLITIRASEVLAAGHGICFAKSHLLAAILRAKGVPAGFCYQKLILDDETAPVLIYHGLNGVYIQEIDKWIRLDARGNKPGVDAQFSLDTEQLAFPIRPEWGEEDGLIIYPDPDELVIKSMSEADSRSKLWGNLPSELGYRRLEYRKAAMVREARTEDLQELLELYLYLHEDSIPEQSEHLDKTWNMIVEDENHHLIVKEVDGKIVSSCVCVIIPNLTRNVRPYAFVENVVTHADYRGHGYAGECLAYAKTIAEKENCYKMMLLTGSKKPETLHFYEKAGYNSSDKTAFIQWL